MTEYFYRFRSTHVLLSGHNELENQEIYFCPSDQLNDPLEGLKDIVWSGDEIVWRNLFRHYLLCFLHAMSLIGIARDKFSPDLCDTIGHQTDADLPDAPIRNAYAEICERFFSHGAPSTLIRALSERQKKVRRDELLFYLRLLHPLALTAVLTVFEQHKLVPAQPPEALDKLTTGIGGLLDSILSVRADAGETADVMFSASENTVRQLALLHRHSNPIGEDERPWQFVSQELPNYYLNLIERVVYPDWHAACFSSNPTNASMWGAYADGHRGICLKFKSQTEANGSSALALHRIVGFGSGKDNHVYGYAPHRFEKIQYTADFPEIDFFGHLGSLPQEKLRGFWYAGPHGARSAIATTVLGADKEWREAYWRRFAASFSTKSSEWAHEQEHRLILYSMLRPFDDMASRKLKYRFDDLAGIIFGIRTSMDDKLKIMRVIEAKCDNETRSDFEFFQAHYSSATKRIELAPLTLLKTG